MLNLWRRHLKSCPHKDIYYRRCQCPVWVMGAFQGVFVRKSLATRSWERGTQITREWEDSAHAENVTLDTAAAKFIEDAESRHIGRDTLAKYRLLFRDMTSWFGKKEVRHIGVDDLGSYRASWKLAPATSLKKLERMRSFFKFCEDRKWVSGNPAKVLKAPKVSVAPTLPFTDAEYEKILWATELFPNGQTMRAFVMLLRHTGLRIKDAVMLKQEHIESRLIDGETGEESARKVFLYTQKTGQPVSIPIPDDVASLLDSVALINPSREYLFWTGSGNPNSCVGNWQRRLQRLFKLAGVKGHAHMFRDTFSVALLQAGVPLETVSILLGHSSIKITEKHYAPWVKSRQENLEAQIKKTWATN